MGTYYTSSSATGGGTGAIDNEWTLQEAEDGALAGDLILVKADGTYLPTAQITIDTSPGTEVAPVIFRGANADGTDDGTVATISGASLPASTSIFFFNLVTASMRLENLRFTASKQHGIWVSSYEYLGLYNCRFDNAFINGVYETSTATAGQAINCEFDNNIGSGYAINSESRGRWMFQFCSFHHNGGLGCYDSTYITSGSKSEHISCAYYDNALDGLRVVGPSGATQAFVRNCTSYNNGQDGFEFEDDVGFASFIGNIASDNGGYGLNIPTGSASNLFVCQNNCTYNNTSGHTNINGGTLPGAGNITEDPNFVDAAGDDYTPQNANCIYSTQIPDIASETYLWMGAVSPRPVTDLPELSSVLTTDTLDNQAGTFDEAARNTDPGIANVRIGTGYDIQGVPLVGTLAVVSGSAEPPTVSNATAGDTTITLSVTPASGEELTPIHAYIWEIGGAVSVSTDTITGAGDLVLTGLTNGTGYGVAAIHKAGDVIGKPSQVYYSIPTDGTESEVELICEAIALQITTEGLLDSAGDAITARYELPPDFNGTDAEIIVFPEMAVVSATHNNANRANYDIHIYIAERTADDASKTNALLNRERIQDILVGSRLANRTAVYVLAEKSDAVLSVDELHNKKRFISVLTVECERMRARL